MNVTMAYLGRSGLRTDVGGRVLQLKPNLSRDRVAFDAPLRSPLRFREAISALHDVVISDLRFEPRDKTAYEEWKKQQRAMEAEVRRSAYKQAKEEILTRRGDVSPDLERDYRTCLHRYWKARRSYASYLLKHDMDLWRKLMPCDPVITVADDVVFFECFSADESSYGCLTVDREETFGAADNVAFGTTNVDYSWDLYNHFQGLRTYRETRFNVDPAGFDVAIEGRPEYREEKIDLPDGWLRGFMQLQAAMGMPMRKVSLSVGSVYSLLAWLKRHKARKSPRAIRFELLDGQAPRFVLEPWEQLIVSQGTVYHGPETEPVRVWGRRRLLVLARVLPLADGVDVYLLGTGLPTFWVVRMGPMRLTLGLSGWTANDWTRGSALDLLASPEQPGEPMITMATEFLQAERAAKFEDVQSRLGAPAGLTAATLNHLAYAGQVICDLHAGCYRWRQIMPMALGEAQIGPPSPEYAAARQLVTARRAKIEQTEQVTTTLRLVQGKVDTKPCEILIDGDGMIKRAKCVCSHFYKAGIRMGPCRHLQALRWVALERGSGPGAAEQTSASWYQQLKVWAGN